ncbi:DUF1684 domain-containing protein [Arthrobacter agilis]|jgi:uncharacterized protein (DUF1684 family)|uniref:DUF1684 domain-containing protein n=1 Tax=Arthrobacter agilis TaxID=37921 RepID=UPI00278A5133|nr:DUF1684 domain-containing protein [Arthrobacter agilis]MDQ0736327.1 uncharacterized protein (DUF1684 family) [Arthrobacter agilis]
MSPTTQTAEDRWARFRAARNAALAETHGWLSLTSFHWLADRPARVGSMPGLWSADGGTASVTAQPSDGLTDLATGRPVDGTLTASLEDEDSLMWMAYGGGDGHRVVVELARRAGRYAIRTRDAEASTLARFTGNPVFDYRPDLVVEGRFEPYAEPLHEQILTSHPDVPGTHTAVGDVVFTLPGDTREHRLRASQDEAGALTVTFHDTTNGVTTAHWRKVSLRRPRPDGSVILDFNRTVNYPSAFTPYGTCPRPVDANVVDAPVEAGEKQP